jgi:hypothetical protein
MFEEGNFVYAPVLFSLFPIHIGILDAAHPDGLAQFSILISGDFDTNPTVTLLHAGQLLSHYP